MRQVCIINVFYDASIYLSLLLRVFVDKQANFSATGAEKSSTKLHSTAVG